jgi:hypothetical protein
MRLERDCFQRVAVHGGNAMVRLFFSVGNGDQVTDDQPVEFATMAEALEQARAIAAELGHNRKDAQIAGHHVRVTDEAGRELYRTPVINQKRRVRADEMRAALADQPHMSDR